jgi:hypothetical protein
MLTNKAKELEHKYKILRVKRHISLQKKKKEIIRDNRNEIEQRI